MAKYQVAYVKKIYVTSILESDSAQEAWNLIKNTNGNIGDTGVVYGEIESLTSINEITEEKIDTASLDL